MKQDIGIWLDHSGAVLVRVSEAGTAVETISSDVEPKRAVRPHARRSGATHRALGGDKHDENRRREHIKAYYTRVARALGSAGRVLVIGPSVAKYEIASMLDGSKGGGRQVLAVEPCDRLTRRQLVRHVETFFAEHPPARGRVSGRR